MGTRVSIDSLSPRTLSPWCQAAIRNAMFALDERSRERSMLKYACSAFDSRLPASFSIVPFLSAKNPQQISFSYQ
jgi:hypothetical protein